MYVLPLWWINVFIILISSHLWFSSVQFSSLQLGLHDLRWAMWSQLNTVNCCRRSGLRIGNIYGPGNGTIWLEDVTCNGDETLLENCTHGGWGLTSSYCDHDDDVTITCSSNLTNAIGKLSKQAKLRRETAGCDNLSIMPNDQLSSVFVGSPVMHFPAFVQRLSFLARNASTIARCNSALHPSVVAKSSTILNWLA